MNILVIAEISNGQLNASTAKAVACASAMHSQCDVAILSDNSENAAQQASELTAVNQVIRIDRTENQQAISAILAPQIAALVTQNNYSHVIAPNTTFGKDLMPCVAALLDSCMVTDIMAVHDAYSFDRPVYAGNAITTVTAPSDHIVVGTTRCASWAPVATGNNASIETAELDVDLPTHTRFVDVTCEQGDRPDLQSAERVVSGGRALGSAENFDIIYKLADKLGAGVGASRAAVDSGFVPNDMQVGQTGKIIAPNLYIAAGISGAIQHIAGIKDAGTVVAINNNPDEPIFEVADIGLVADLFNAIPELTEKLS